MALADRVEKEAGSLDGISGGSQVEHEVLCQQLHIDAEFFTMLCKGKANGQDQKEEMHCDDCGGGWMDGGLVRGRRSNTQVACCFGSTLASHFISGPYRESEGGREGTT